MEPDVPRPASLLRVILDGFGAGLPENCDITMPPDLNSLRVFAKVAAKQHAESLIGRKLGTRGRVDLKDYSYKSQDGETITIFNEDGFQLFRVNAPRIGNGYQGFR